MSSDFEVPFTSPEVLRDQALSFPPASLTCVHLRRLRPRRRSASGRVAFDALL